MKNKLDHNDVAVRALTIAALAFGWHCNSFSVFIGTIAFGIFMYNEKKA